MFSFSDLCLTGFGAVQRRALPLAERASPLALFRLSDGDRGGLGRPTIVLTIDDGPSSRTAEMLDLLRRHKASATFFLHTDHIDSTPGGEALVRRMLAEGHEVGNHMPADVPSATLSAERFAAEFRRSDARLRELGAAPTLFRPAGGGFNDARMGPVLDELGYEHQYVLGSYLPWDVAVTAPKQYADQLARGLFPGAVLVLHDGDHTSGPRAENTVVTLERLLSRLDEQGYQARSLGEARRLTPSKLEPPCPAPSRFAG